MTDLRRPKIVWLVSIISVLIGLTYTATLAYVGYFYLDDEPFTSLVSYQCSERFQGNILLYSPLYLIYWTLPICFIAFHAWRGRTWSWFAMVGFLLPPYDTAFRLLIADPCPGTFYALATTVRLAGSACCLLAIILFLRAKIRRYYGVDQLSRKTFWCFLLLAVFCAAMFQAVDVCWRFEACRALLACRGTSIEIENCELQDPHRVLPECLELRAQFLKKLSVREPEAVEDSAEYQHADLLWYLGKSEEALNVIKRTIDRRESEEDEWKVLEADIQHSLGQTTTAQETLTRIVAANGSNLKAKSVLAYSYADSGTNLDKALVLIQEVLQVKPRKVEYLNILARIYFKHGNYELASTTIQNALAIERNNPDSLELFGDILLASGKPEEALKQFNAAFVSVNFGGYLVAPRSKASLQKKLQKFVSQ